MTQEKQKLQKAASEIKKAPLAMQAVLFCYRIFLHSR